MSHLRVELVSIILGAAALITPAQTHATPMPFKEPLSEKYFRTEIIVPTDFKADCKARNGGVSCKVSTYNQELLKVISLGIKEGIDVRPNPSRKELFFYFQDKQLTLQDRVLSGPPRWVIEIGYPETLLQAIEDELPFRPYPIPVQTVQLERPPMMVKELSGEGPGIDLFKRCWSEWEAKRLTRAWRSCTAVTDMPEASTEAKNAAIRLKAEIIYKHFQRLSDDEITARNYIGKEVFYINNKIKHVSGRSEEIRFEITDQVESAQLVITNSNGVAVAKNLISNIQPGETQRFAWDAISQEDQKSELPSDDYTVTINLKSAKERNPIANIYVKGRVTRYRRVQGLPKLVIDKKLVNLNAVKREDNPQGGKNPKGYFKMNLDDAINVIKRAQQATNRNERERARYILLTADLKSDRSPSEAIEYLHEQQRRFPIADPYLLAEEVRLLFQIDSYDEAQKVIQEIDRLDTSSDDLAHVKGAQLLALASIAYSRHNYTDATRLYSEVYEQAPELLIKEAGPLFQAAESFHREGRLEAAEVLYSNFLKDFDGEFPHWIVKIRLAQIKAHKRPIEASQEMSILGEELKDPEGIYLSQLYSISLANDKTPQINPETILKRVSESTPTPTAYVNEELWLQQARLALHKGDIEEAFKHSQKIIKQAPNSSLRKQSPLFFQRILLLYTDLLLRNKRYAELFLLFLKEKELRFKEPQAYSILHLYVARATRALNMLEIAIENVIQRGEKDTKYPRISALLMLEKTSIYRELIQDGDTSGAETRVYIDKFKRHVEEIEKRYYKDDPDTFDNYDYWASIGYYHELKGDFRKAKQIYLYALNGNSVSPKERLLLGESIFKVYERIPDKEKALHALKVLLAIYDEYRVELNMPVFRSKILWRRVELAIDLAKWPLTVKAIKEYLKESQSFMSSTHTQLINSKNPTLQREMNLHLASLVERRREALFYHGYALLKIGLVRQAKREWDLLYKEAPKDNPYGVLAELELRMLTWRDAVAPELGKLMNNAP